MRLLDISIDLGPGASPAALETLVRAVRVTTDVAHDAETARVRRAVTERLKFPTDRELTQSLEQLAGGEDGPRDRARRQLEARQYAQDERRNFPLEFWFDY